MTSPFTPPSDDTGIVPPNRVSTPSPLKTLAIWVFIVLLSFVLYLTVSGGRPSPEPRPSPPDTRQGSALGLVIPLVTYLGMALALLRVRARLPARYRTGELREIEDARPASVEPAVAEPISLSLSGTNGAQKVRLDIDGEGLHWHQPGGVLAPPRELHVAWTDLQAISTARVSGNLLTLGVVVTGVSLVALAVEPSWALVGTCSGVLMMWVGRGESSGSISFTTATHALQFFSPAASAEVQERIRAAARARAPRVVAAQSQGALSVLFSLFAEPFVLLYEALGSDEQLRSRLARRGGVTSASPDDGPAADEARASLIQARLFAIWRGVLCGLGPLSVGLGVAIASPLPLMRYNGWILAFFVGLVAVTKTMALFARFSGMSLMRPA